MSFEIDFTDPHLNVAFDLWVKTHKRAMAISNDDVAQAHHLIEYWAKDDTELAKAIEKIDQIISEIDRLHRCGKRQELKRLSQIFAYSLKLSELSVDMNSFGEGRKLKKM